MQKKGTVARWPFSAFPCHYQHCDCPAFLLSFSLRAVESRSENFGRSHFLALRFRAAKNPSAEVPSSKKSSTNKDMRPPLTFFAIPHTCHRRVRTHSLEESRTFLPSTQWWVAIHFIAILLQYAIELIAIWGNQMLHIAIQSSLILTYWNYWLTTALAM